MRAALACASTILSLVTVAASQAAPLDDKIDSLLALEPLRGSSWSILFSEVDGPLDYAARDADRLLIPASVTKLWTTATALSELGAETRFTTKLASPMSIDGQGALNSDLLCFRGGDPAFEIKSRKDLGGPALDKLADGLKAKGLKRVSGNLVICTGRYERTCGNGVWEMGDLREGFAPAVDGAGFNSNVCNVKIGPGAAEGDTSVVTFDPPFAQIKLINRVLTASSGNDSWVEFNVTPCRDELELTGVMARGDEPQYIWFPIQEPALYFGLAMRDALARKGITIGGQVLVRDDQGPAVSHTLLEFASPPIAELIATVNKESDNYVAEYLLAAVGVKRFRSRVN
ncbi:MAG: D-alanyl-D-alanine carboxypeptidase/D-alanyl-D-alanine-endopeptidase [bacterium]|nr:D-alanyl-D-alanine carboxypeptidase/D-alanyl-D-alanine-endopeptidase [bacterium]